ncbi:MAG: hypothetical protein M3Z02_10705, partial [Actinomycetota bacterium]|nr:hypothetical protein [Actinomycetota bacterium]
MGQPFRPTKLRAPSRSTAVRLAIGATVVGTLAVLRPGLVADTLTSPRALLLVVATVAVSRVSARVARPLGRGPATAAGWLPVIVVGWLFVVPYFRSTELHEQLPAVSA